MKKLIGFLTLLGVVAGLQAGALAEMKHPADGNLPGVQQIFNLIGNISLNQVDRKNTKAMSDMLDMKGQLYQVQATHKTTDATRRKPSAAGRNAF